jgi:hypothetical protein
VKECVPTIFSFLSAFVISLGLVFVPPDTDTEYGIEVMNGMEWNIKWNRKVEVWGLPGSSGPHQPC